MSVSKHTPGPWAAFTDDTSSDQPHTNIVAVVPRTACVFSLPGMHKNDPDVRLIAAAPALLEALQRIATATPASTNSQTVEQFRSWTQAVAAEVLSLACGEQADAG